MKRTLIALAAAAGLGLSAGVASADPGGYAPPGPGASMGTFGPVGGPNTLLGAGDLPPGRGPDMYGLHPCIKRFFHIPAGGGKHGGCGPGGCGAGGYGGGHNALANPGNWGAGGYGMGGPAYNAQGYPPGAYGPYGPMMQGTLVFPHQPFARSPRDFFMLDLNK
jgi:hypothetical protein